MVDGWRWAVHHGMRAKQEAQTSTRILTAVLYLYHLLSDPHSCNKPLHYCGVSYVAGIVLLTHTTVHAISSLQAQGGPVGHVFEKCRRLGRSEEGEGLCALRDFLRQGPLEGAFPRGTVPRRLHEGLACDSFPLFNVITLKLNNLYH